VTATAHKLARLLYQTLKSGVLLAKVSAAEYAAAQHERAVQALKKKAWRLGPGGDGERLAGHGSVVVK
jgi:hypothetical protein